MRQIIMLMVLPLETTSARTNTTEYLLKLCFICISPKLRKDINVMHKKFVQQCYDQLAAAMQSSAAVDASSSSLNMAVQQGFELETSDNQAVKAHGQINYATHDTAEDSTRLRTIRRLLHLAERYVSVVELAFHGKRSILPHAVTFYGRPTTLQVLYEAKKDEFEVQVR